MEQPHHPDPQTTETTSHRPSQPTDHAVNPRPPTGRAAEARETIRRSIDELSDQLAAGNSERLDAFLAAMGRFHRYSVGNIMLIIGQRPDATHVAGFHTWRSLGRAVRKGEKGIAILAPMRVKAQRSGDQHSGASHEDADEEPGAAAATILRFRIVHVFDIAQTDGKTLPEPARIGGDPGASLIRLEDAVRAGGITLETVDSLGGADGVSRGGAIQLREGLTDAERFSVLVHEWAHELLHRGEGADRPTKRVRETEAEAVAFVVSRAIGLDTNTASADYIRTYAGDPETLAASLERIQQGASTIIAVLEEDDANTPAKDTDLHETTSEPPHSIMAAEFAQHTRGPQR